MIPRPVRKAVIARNDQRCERCGVWCDTDGGYYSLQHRRARQGTDKRPDTHTAVNLALLCGSATTKCHGWVEAHPLESLEDGWRVPQHEDPATVPIRHHELGPILLAADFTYEELLPHGTGV